MQIPSGGGYLYGRQAQRSEFIASWGPPPKDWSKDFKITENLEMSVGIKKSIKGEVVFIEKNGMTYRYDPKENKISSQKTGESGLCSQEAVEGDKKNAVLNKFKGYIKLANDKVKLDDDIKQILKDANTKINKDTKVELNVFSKPFPQPTKEPD